MTDAHLYNNKKKEWRGKWLCRTKQRWKWLYT